MFKSDKERNDQVTLIAIGSTQDVSIYVVVEKD
jgi:hypothetical protein